MHRIDQCIAMYCPHVHKNNLPPKILGYAAMSTWVKSLIENFALLRLLPREVRSPKFDHF